MKDKSKKSAAVVTAQKKLEKDHPVTLSTGIKVRLIPVAASLIGDVASQIKDPEVPMQYMEEKQREEPNPNHPEYKKALREAEIERSNAALEALVMFGVELVDGVPPVAEWLPKLRFLEKRGRLSLKAYDLKDDLELEFVFKRYVAMSQSDIMAVMRISGVNEEDISQAAESFRSEET